MGGKVFTDFKVEDFVDNAGKYVCISYFFTVNVIHFPFYYNLINLTILLILLCNIKKNL